MGRNLVLPARILAADVFLMACEDLSSFRAFPLTAPGWEVALGQTPAPEKALSPSWAETLTPSLAYRRQILQVRRE